MLIAIGATAISGCSTLGIDPPPVEPVKIAAVCPHPATFASYKTFTYKTEVRTGESAFQTVKRFRLAEKEKNDAGKRLWRGMKQCRSRDAPAPESGAGFLGLSAIDLSF